ncbi:MAG: hypothetical protein ACOYM3_26045 [Terrimicrobiaceae bacterium]
MKTTRSAWLLGALTFAAALHADVTPHALFCNHAVLQRDKPIPVWGQAAPGEKVTVRLAEKIAETAVAGADGRWSVRLPAQPAGGPFALVSRRLLLRPRFAPPVAGADRSD